MKILFVMSSPEYLRFYDATIVELAARGHQVIVATNTVRDLKPVRFDALGDTRGRVTVVGLVPPRGDMWTAFARWIRGTLDYVRYLHPRLASAAVLRARLKRQGLPLLLQWVDVIPRLPEAMLRRLMGALAAAERVVPVSSRLTAFLGEHNPDLLLVSPLVEPASEQVDVVRAAHARGIPTAALIASWDNLTNKGDIKIQTDLVVVWNDAQKREAVELHRVPSQRVAVTGSQVFDRWFGRAASRTRDEFCGVVGLPSNKPFVLFVGSSVFISRANVEVPFVRSWIQALRASPDPAVRDLGVLIRPHPYNGAQWADADLSGLGDVAVWPKGKHNPVDELNRADFFDSMFHSEAVVGINTSAMIEAAIVGRPVLSVLTPEFSGTQEGTLHFHHLLPENGGFLRVASGFDEHLAQLSAIIREPQAARDQLAGFVRSFVRPHGTDRACTPIVVEALENLGSTAASSAVTDSVLMRTMRVVALPMAWLAAVFPEEALRKRALTKWVRERWRKGVRAWERRTRSTAKLRKVASSAAPRAGNTAAMIACLVFPFVIATLVVFTFAASELAGRPLFVYDAPQNLAEAAGMGLSAEVLRFLRAGQDPRAVMSVRPHIISSDIVRVTALEAAVWSRRVRLMRLLEREGALSDQQTRAVLACLASDIRATDIQPLLAVGQLTCEPEAAVRSIASRSR